MMDSLTLFLLAFGFNLAVTTLIVRCIYYPSYRDKEYVLTFFALNTSIFLITFLLSDTNLSIGFGFSLFAIFSILRYRTDPLPVREMTYLFILMAQPVVDAVLITQGAWGEAILANAAILAIFFAIERVWNTQSELRKSITYEKIELIKADNYPLLVADLRQRTGLNISRCDVGRIDFLHDVAEIKIAYSAPTRESQEESREANRYPMPKSLLHHSRQDHQ
jgi:uncharacterized protein DUF4956